MINADPLDTAFNLAKLIHEQVSLIYALTIKTLQTKCQEYKLGYSDT